MNDVASITYINTCQNKLWKGLCLEFSLNLKVDPEMFLLFVIDGFSLRSESNLASSIYTWKDVFLLKCGPSIIILYPTSNSFDSATSIWGLILTLNHYNNGTTTPHMRVSPNAWDLPSCEGLLCSCCIGIVNLIFSYIYIYIYI
jgi:hypothetical protein